VKIKMMYDLHLDLRDLMLIAIDILIVFIRILKFKSENRNSKNRRIQSTIIHIDIRYYINIYIIIIIIILY
jgi:uncharacterized membrane protein